MHFLSFSLGLPAFLTSVLSIRKKYFVDVSGMFSRPSQLVFIAGGF